MPIICVYINKYIHNEYELIHNVDPITLEWDAGGILASISGLLWSSTCGEAIDK